MSRKYSFSVIGVPRKFKELSSVPRCKKMLGTTAVEHGGGRLVSFGRTARSSTKEISLSANSPIMVFMAAVNDWRL